MKRAIRLILALLALCGASGAFSAGPAADNGLLWRIESDHALASYLFGTIHSEDPRVLEMADAIVPRIEASRLFVMELEPRPDMVTALSERMHFSDGRNLRDVIGRPLFAKAVQAMAVYGVPEGLVIKMKPWAVVLTLSVPPPKTGLFLDMALYMAALRREIPVMGLETVDEQLSFFEELSIAQQTQLLEETIRTRDRLQQSFEELVGAYVQRDLNRLEHLNDKYLGETSPQIAELFRSRLLDLRNERMLERILPVLREGNAFIAVGALHLPGEKGLIHGLRERGFRVSAVK